MAKEAYYFSHDSNAHNDTKILSMVCDYGMAGYGMYWVLIENLRDQSDFRLKHDKQTWRALAMKMQCTCEAVKKYIEDCVYEYALLDITEDMYFYSRSLDRRMNKYLESKEKRIAAANKRWNKDEENAKDMQSTCNTDAMDMQSNANKIKLNEIKENTYSAFFESIWSLYPCKRGKGAIKETQIKRLYSLGYETVKKCIDRYTKTKPDWQQYQNGSTFFNSGYKDYLDENFVDSKPQDDGYRRAD